MKKKAMVIGSGITGSIAAWNLANNGWHVEVYDQINEIGGHLASGKINNIVYEKYGPHIFHTNDENVVNIIKKFGKFNKYEHMPKSIINDKLFSWPPQIHELQNSEYWVDIKKELSLLSDERKLDNFEEYAISLMGKTIYNLFIYEYAKKHWKTEPKNLSYSFAPKRIDIRNDKDLRVFKDKWQLFPKNGWSCVIESMLDNKNINIILGLKHDKDTINWKLYDAVIVTAPLDDFLKKESLPWRGVRVENKYIPNQIGTYLPAAQINYPTLKVSYNRITETKWMTNQKNNGTVISYEYPDDNLKHYPIDDIYNNNRNYANNLKNILISSYKNAIPAGRLANYVYIDIDQAINQGINASKKALELIR